MKESSGKRVLILLPFLDLGGAEKQGFYIARSLKNSGRYEVVLASLQEGTGNLRSNLYEYAIETVNLDIPFEAFYNRRNRLAVYLKFLIFLRKKKIDILLPFTYHCNVMSASVFRFAGVKTCLWFQIAMEYHLPLSTFEKLALKFSPTYAANSKSAAKFIANKHQKPENEIHIIPNPFEVLTPKMSGKNWRKKLGLNNQDKMLFMAANFFPEKDHNTLIRGFSLALKKNPHLKLVLAGNDTSGKADNIRSLSFQLGLSIDNVIFVGSTSDVSGLIEAADICLLTSISEGSPNALIEYLGYGKPVVASAIPSIIELTGSDYLYLFEPGNSINLKEKIEDICNVLNEKETLNRMNQLRKNIRSIYSVESNLEAFEKILIRE